MPNSIVFGRSVYRHKYGEILATEAPVECDVVIAVPDFGVVAALALALSLQKTLMGAGFKETKDENGKSTSPVTEKDEVVASTKDCCLHNRTLGYSGCVAK
ncbi:hypothetical protein POM88_016600 [Heracleum sosnowskyi]|uniref:Uncharacterized protein n=1 Tax=Heracleum sosnowskyi TaxID=360622 RepID=A0AAD8IQ45_9APIA|nr:hypothetical protein POM88_016600 [Heracleum sosnowskyi]